MRRILFALITLACFMPPTADAARRDERGTQAASRTTQSAKPTRPESRQASRPAASRATTRTSTRSTTARRSSAARPQQGRAAVRAGDVRTSRSSLVVRGASAATVSRESVGNCRRSNGRTICSQRDGVAGWQAGLPRADYTQRDCPAGTFATLARGHDDVVRCMPL